MRILTCRYCKEKFDADKGIENIDWTRDPEKKICYYHMDCWNIIVQNKKDKELEREKKAKEKEEMLNNYKTILDMNTIELIKDTKDIDFKKLSYYYLKFNLKMNIDYLRFESQWKNYTEKKTYRSKGIYLTLRYAYDICNLQPDKAKGAIGIVDWKYKEANEYWNKIMIENPERCRKLTEQIIKMNEVEKVEVVVKNKKKRGPRYDLIGEDDG